ncbi:hypothetical protein [Deinococcus sp. Leaf326]|uniref:hypothetical protein n=1 Tax=Deinococcus sp. Leaf326 TaxID=1736338 RepID=UPI0006FA4BBC|nr:hypothetical protein [Deinococcus sp. Leaf326]KQR33119.1 hypothetical protein ASF71_16645 [Deinococcus sp. Leaf326]
MPTWRDDWDGDPQVIVVAPGAPRGGVLRQAIVILNDAQTEALVTVANSLGQRVTFTLPPDLLNVEGGLLETNCILRTAQPKRTS